MKEHAGTGFTIALSATGFHAPIYWISVEEPSHSCGGRIRCIPIPDLGNDSPSIWIVVELLSRESHCGLVFDCVNWISLDLDMRLVEEYGPFYRTTTMDVAIFRSLAASGVFTPKCNSQECRGDRYSQARSTQ